MHKKDEEIEQLIKSFEEKTYYISILLPQDKKTNKGKNIKQKKVIKPNLSIDDNYYDKGFDGLQSFQGNIMHRQKQKKNNLREIEATIKEILNQKQAEIKQYNETVNIKSNQDALCENDYKKTSCQQQYQNQKQQNENPFYNDIQSLQVENSHIFSQSIIDLKKNKINDRNQNMRHLEQNNINLQNKCKRQDNQLYEQDLQINQLIQFQQFKQQNGDFSPLNYLNSNSSKSKTYNIIEIESNKEVQLTNQKNYQTQIKLYSQNQIGQDKSESESEKENQIMSNYSDLSQLQSKSPKIEQNNLKSPIKYGNKDNIKNKQKDQINVNNIFDNNCEIKNEFLDHVFKNFYKKNTDLIKINTYDKICIKNSNFHSIDSQKLWNYFKIQASIFGKKTVLQLNQNNWKNSLIQYCQNILKQEDEQQANLIRQAQKQTQENEEQNQQTNENGLDIGSFAVVLKQKLVNKKDKDQYINNLEIKDGMQEQNQNFENEQNKLKQNNLKQENLQQIFDNKNVLETYQSNIIQTEGSNNQIIIINGQVYLKQFNEQTKQSKMINIDYVSDIDLQNGELQVDQNQYQNDENLSEQQLLEKKYMPQQFQPFFWTPMIAYDDFPEKRGGHTLNIIGNSLILFGGCNLDIEYYNDLFIFDLSQKNWQKIKTFGNQPTPRAGHTSTVYGSYLYIFGGADQKGVLQDLFRLDIEERKWEQLYLEGPMPSARANHKAVLNKKNIVIFGGYTVDGYANDVYFLDIVNQKWQQPVIHGQTPLGRELFGFEKVKEDVIYMFGGYSLGISKNDIYQLNLEQMRWDLLDSRGTKPSPRQGFSMIKHNSNLIIFGGCDYIQKQCFKEMYSMNINDLEWQQIQINDGVQLQEENQGFVKSGDVIITFGGCNMMENCTDNFFAFNLNEEIQCTQNGILRNNRCVCQNGYQGDNCSEKLICPFDCYQRGICGSNAKCQCFPGYNGEMCEIYIPCPQNCTSPINGICNFSGQCECDDSFYGDDCSIQKVIENNNLNLQNIQQNYKQHIQAIIQDGEIIQDFKINQLYNQPCLNNCSDNGLCNYKLGKCVCKDGYLQDDCSQNEQQNDLDDSQNQLIQQSQQLLQGQDYNIYLQVKEQGKQYDDLSNCVNKCSGKGVCIEGKCYCDFGVMGDDCSATKLKDLNKGKKPSTLIFYSLIALLFGFGLGFFVIKKQNREEQIKEFEKLQNSFYSNVSADEQILDDDNINSINENQNQQNQVIFKQENESDDSYQEEDIQESEIQDSPLKYKYKQQQNNNQQTGIWGKFRTVVDSIPILNKFQINENTNNSGQNKYNGTQFQPDTQQTESYYNDSYYQENQKLKSMQNQDLSISGQFNE